MGKIRNRIAGRKWYEKYLPFVAKSQKMQLEWLVDKLSQLGHRNDEGKNVLLSREELQPYISLLIEGDGVEGGEGIANDGSNGLGALLESVAEADLTMMVECAEIYEIPKLFGILCEISKEQAVLAMKKMPPLHEKTPLLLIDRVFHAIKENSTALLEDAANIVMSSDDVPKDFVANYSRFKEIMLDEHILRLLYPKAN
jgi:hypothetical protein